MGAVGKVQMTGDKVVDVVAVWHCGMATGAPVAMPGLMSLAAMGRCAAGGVVVGDVQPVFIDVVAVQVV
ncbi:MAG: hypothetical protein NBKEAIPA_02106 [Nitrospirae bacterium]|nr:hypothetical protein [Nitrospirota bacterium]